MTVDQAFQSMTDDTAGRPDAEPVAEAVDLLTRFGFTEYEAKCYVALVRLGDGTAREISELADVPRARVYDCVEALNEAGFVDVQGSSPKRYRGVAPETAIDAIERDVERDIDRLGTLLPQLRTSPDESDQGDVWVMEGLDAVGERLADMVDDADERIVMAVATESLLETDLPAALGRAVDRGVDVTVGSPGEPIRQQVGSAAPDATVVETWTWWESYPIRPGAMSAVCMGDSESLLVSADAGSSLPGVSNHRAVWTDSAETPLVKLMRPLLTNAISRQAAGA